MAAHSSYTDNVPARAGHLAADGASGTVIATKLGITRRTLLRWKVRYPALCDALSEGYAIAQDRMRGCRDEAEAVAFLGDEAVVLPLKHIVPLAPHRAVGMTGVTQ